MGKITTALGKTNYFEEHQHRPPKMEVPYENRSPKIGHCVELFEKTYFPFRDSRGFLNVSEKNSCYLHA